MAIYNNVAISIILLRLFVILNLTQTAIGHSMMAQEPQMSHLQLSQPTRNQVEQLSLPPTLAPVYHTHGNIQAHHQLDNEEHLINSTEPFLETEHPYYMLRTNNGPAPVKSGQYSYMKPFTSDIRDVYATRDSAGNPIFGVNSNADFKLAAYFGKTFWSAVALVATVVGSVYAVKFFAGYDIVAGIVNKIRGSTSTAKSLDLDFLTNMVYGAFETYGKYTAKEDRHEVIDKKTGEKKQG